MSSPEMVVTLPKPAAVRYAYVDSYRIDGGAETSCASEPAAARSWANGHPPRPRPNSRRFAAVSKGSLPPLPCGKTFADARVTRAFQPAGINTTHTNTVDVGVFVDSAGHPVQAWVQKSSGIDVADSRAVAAAQHSQYAPATFLCTPVVSEYIFRVDFDP